MRCTISLSRLLTIKFFTINSSRFLCQFYNTKIAILCRNYSKSRVFNSIKELQLQLGIYLPKQQLFRSQSMKIHHLESIQMNIIVSWMNFWIRILIILMIVLVQLIMKYNENRKYRTIKMKIISQIVIVRDKRCLNISSSNFSSISFLVTEVDTKIVTKILSSFRIESCWWIG